MYRKFSADHIFTGFEIIPGRAVLITDNFGAVIEIVDAKDAGDEIESFRGLITPGFINAHCHLELSHLKGLIAENAGLVGFVQQVMRSRYSSGELKMDAMINAESEMYSAGIVAVGDICNTTDSIPVKQQSKILWHNFIEVSGFVDATARQRLEEVKKFHEQFLIADPEKSTTLSPHAAYSVSKKLFQLLNDETAGQVISIHNQESSSENELYQHKNGNFLTLYKNFGIDISGFEHTGKSSFQSWLPFFTKRQSIISVHNTFTDEADLEFGNNQSKISNSQVFYCVCINANKYIEQKVPPINLLRKMNCKMVIGTDSYASNFQLNILDEIKKIQDELNYTVPLQELLQWATINGARALKLDHTLGSFDKGKKPGIVLIEMLNDLQTTHQSFARRIL